MKLCPRSQFFCELENFSGAGGLSRTQVTDPARQGKGHVFNPIISRIVIWIQWERASNLELICYQAAPRQKPDTRTQKHQNNLYDFRDLSSFGFFYDVQFLFFNTLNPIMPIK